MQRGNIDLIEMAYRTDLEPAAWVEALAHAVPRRAGSLGVSAYTYRIQESGQLQLLELAHPGVPGMELVVRETMGTMPAAYVRQTWATLPCETALRSGPQEIRAHTRILMQQLFGRFGLADILVMNGIDPTGHGVYIGDLHPAELSLSRRAKATGARVASHLAAAYRLRRGTAVEEAVISPAGKVEHAVEEARGAASLESLREAAISIDRARSRRRRSQDEAVEMWKALVGGRWTLVDRIDRDGRRYFVARKNDPEVVRHHALTTRERQVVAYAALGHSNKLIGYEMGLSVSTIAVYLDVAIEKLGVASRAELIVAARAFGGP